MTTVAPFLTLDQRSVSSSWALTATLYWMIDAYTSSDGYPYSRHFTSANWRVNYIRNSVKTVVDAYDGSVSFYVFDPKRTP